jgi:cytochrome c peroxidase
MKIKSFIFFGLALSAIIWACAPEESSLKESYLDLPALPYSYNVMTDPNGINDHIPTLGRVLFYDRQLSVNNSVSCSSCHKQNLAFADNVAFSTGFDNRLTLRNSMPIQNLLAQNFVFLDSGFSIRPEVSSSSNFFAGTSAGLFWDGREGILQTMVLKPIGNHVEMGISDMNILNQKLSSIPYYRELFTKAFDSPEVTTEKIGKALSSFLLSITSRNTKADHSMINTVLDDKFNTTDESIPHGELSAIEERGMNLFTTVYDCNACHQVQNPHGYIMAGTFANIGLDAQYADNGLQNVTKRSSDAGKFKIPSLRNVALTAPYMHDGRFETLNDVLDHYSEGIANHPNLDKRLKKDGQAMRLQIPQHDKDAIIAFLHTLTDYEMIKDPKFSNPFKIKQ